MNKAARPFFWGKDLKTASNHSATRGLVFSREAGDLHIYLFIALSSVRSTKQGEYYLMYAKKTNLVW